MRLITVCTHADGWFEALRTSARRHGYTLTLLGWGEPWTGFSMRYRLIKAHLRSLPPDEVVCTVDGYDAIVLVDADEALRRYRRLAPNGEVVVGVEARRHPRFL